MYSKKRMKVFNIAQIKKLDEYTIRHEPVSSENLMLRASEKFTEALQKEITRSDRIFAFAGPGNNGGDARIIARLLAERGYRVSLFECITEDFVVPGMEEADVIIDGLFGAGINRPLTGTFAKVVQALNRSRARIYSIDIPSGLFGEDNSGNNREAIVKAYRTFTFQTPKLSFFFGENYRFTNEWEVLDIGLHPDAIAQTETPWNYLEREEITNLRLSRNRFAHKGNFGHALLLAGSRGKIGAALLAAKACLRAGAGLLTVSVPRCGEEILQTAFPEAMTLADAGDEHLSGIPDIRSYQAIGIGPGIGQHPETAQALQQLLNKADRPLVLDADALNLLVLYPELQKRIPPGSILTPHPKEFDRMAGPSENSFERLNRARELAATLHVIVILKGAFTAICTPEGEVFFNSTGNPGMATAGSGDVLTGVLTGLLAQSYSPERAAKLGVYLHGAAGDLATGSQSEESLVAGDIINCLGKAFNEL